MDMPVSTCGRYATRMLPDIAQHPGDGYVSMKCIAGRQRISKNTWNGSPRSLRGWPAGHPQGQAGRLPARPRAPGSDAGGRMVRDGGGDARGGLPGGHAQPLRPLWSLRHIARMGRA